MKFFTSLLLSTAVAVSTVSAGIYSEINGDVLGRGLPHEVQLPARSNHFLSFARRSEIIENYYRNHPEEEDVSFEVRTGQDAAVKRSDFGVNGAKKMHRRKKSSCSAKKSSSSSSAAPKATAKAASVKTTETKNTSNKSTDSSSSSSSGSYCYNDVISGAMSMDELMSKTPSSFQSLKSTIEAAAKQYQLQPELLVAIAGQESTFCTNISNGYGCMQFSDDGAWAKYGDGKSKWDNGASIWAGAAYLHDLIGQNGGSLYNALRSYNGPIAWGGLPSYQSDVFNKMKGIF